MSLEDVSKILHYDQTILSLIYKINSQYECQENGISSLLNKIISSSQSRWKGLEVLSANIESFPIQFVLDNAFIWLNICIVHHHEPLKEIKLTIIGRLVERAYKDPDFAKKFLGDHMAKILEQCLSSQVNSHEMEAALTTLGVCMNRFGSWFGAHKSKIESFLIKFLFCESKTLVEKVAQTFVHLQQVGGAGVNRINYESNFSAAFHKLCVTVQKLFDQLFENQAEIEEYDVSNEEGFSFPVPINNISRIALYVENGLTFIKIMMMRKFPAVKQIKPIDVLNIIIRGTALHLCLSTPEEKSLQEFQFSVSLNCIQISLMELLNIFIIWLQGNSLPFSYTLSKILIDCLSRSQNCKCFKINSLYRETVYKVLNQWLSVARCAFHVNFQTRLVDCILVDITPKKNAIKLIVNHNKSEKSKNKSKSIRDSIVESGHKNSWRMLSDSERQQQEVNCFNALKTLKYLLSSNWFRVNMEKLQHLHSVLISILMEVITKKETHPYTNSTCQEKLYEVLVTFYEEDNLSVIPNVNVVLDILNKGWNSTNSRIAAVCERGVSYLEKLCQPICPSLYGSEILILKEAINIETSFIHATSEVTQHNESEADVEQPSDMQNEEFNNQINTSQPTHMIDENEFSSIDEPNKENDLHTKTITRVNIIDVHILNTPINEAFCESTLKSEVYPDVNHDQRENIGEIDEKTKQNNLSITNTEMKDHVSVDDAQESTSNAVPANFENDVIDEPPSKIIKLEMKSEVTENIDDEFVDLVKEY